MAEGSMKLKKYLLQENTFQLGFLLYGGCISKSGFVVNVK